MRLVYKFEFHSNKTTSLVLGLSTYAAARLYNVGNYERHNFKELDKRPVHEVESSILENWKKQDILNKTIENRKNGED